MTKSVIVYQAIKKAVIAMGTPLSIMGGQTVSHRLHATLSQKRNFLALGTTLENFWELNLPVGFLHFK